MLSTSVVLFLCGLIHGWLVVLAAVFTISADSQFLKQKEHRS